MAMGMKAMGVRDLVREAREQVEAVEPAAAGDGGGLILDVREANELEKTRVPGALHVPRGLLESNADPQSPMANERLTGMRDGGTVDVLCASGARAAMAAATLDRMGYRARVIEGGLEGWRKAGLPIEGGR